MLWAIIRILKGTKTDIHFLLSYNYREYDTYKVYDQGITSKWNWLSNPYFIISIAKEVAYESSRTVTATISGNISGNFPSGAKKFIFNVPAIRSYFEDH